MPVSGPCLIRSRGSLREPVVPLGMPLVDDYLEFVAGGGPTGHLRTVPLFPKHDRWADTYGL
jgi:hypothetical protein